MKVVVQHHIGTTDEWKEANPKLYEAVWGFEKIKDGKVLAKLGNGLDRWNNLKYFDIENIHGLPEKFQADLNQALQAVTEEAQARASTDQNLQQAINDETQARELAVTGEAQTRASTDQNLQQAINDETQARELAVIEEAQARIQSFNNLAQSIAALSPEGTEEFIQNIPQLFETETQARVAADQDLQQAIEDEVQARELAVTGEAQARASADQNLQQAIEDEVQARELAVTGEAQARASVDQDLQQAIDQKAEKNHASTTTDYGAANGATYGHVRFPTAASTTNIPKSALPYEYIGASTAIDLNTYLTAGVYVFYNPSAASANFPANWGTGTTNAAILEVLPFYSSTVVRQILHKRGTNQIWVRYSTSASAWGAWENFSGKAPLASPELTGTPTAPTAGAKNNSAQIATTAYADRAGHPVGSYYTQYPVVGQSTIANMFPESKSPGTLFGGTWTELFVGEEVFFKTAPSTVEANRGKTYNTSTKLWSGTGTTGIQGDAIKNFAGRYIQSYGDFSGSLQGPSGYNGPFYEEGSTHIASNERGAEGVAEYDASTNKIGYSFDPSRVVPIDTTNHPKNRLIKVWEKTAA